MDIDAGPYNCQQWGDYGFTNMPPITFTNDYPDAIFSGMELPGGVPRMVVIDKEGKFIAQYGGADTKSDETWDYIESLLNNGSPCSIGCTDPQACNYDEDASYDDGSCDYGHECDDGTLQCIEDDCGDCGVNEVEIFGDCYDIETTTELDFWITPNQTGPFPSQVCLLTNLTYLRLNEINLYGEIPECIGDLVNLEFLDISMNDLTGTIPSTIGNLINLEYFYAYSPYTNPNEDERLSGPIPPEIGYLTNLKQLLLHSNQHTGEIPNSIGRLINLEKLSLMNNQLTGGIPNSITRLTNLKHLSLSENQLTGRIPVDIGNMTSLQKLYLHRNQFNGEIPYNIGNLSNLDRLYLYENQLSGKIPPTICNLEFDPMYKRLNDNRLCPPYPFNVGPPGDPNPEQCLLEYSVGFQDTTSCLDIGCIDSDACNYDETALYDDGSCEYSETTNCYFDSDGDGDYEQYMGEFQICPNGHWNGTIPTTCFDINRYYSEVQTISSGCMDSIACNYDPTADVDDGSCHYGWECNDGSFQCHYDDCNDCENGFAGVWGVCYDTAVNCSYLSETCGRRIFRNSQGIIGSIPPNLPDLLPHMQELIVGNNELYGEIPPEIGLFYRLDKLSLRQNNLSGEIPWSSIMNLNILQELELSYNNFEPYTLPDEIGNFGNLQSLKLGSTNLTGTLPPSLANLVTNGNSAYVELWLMYNDLSGQVPEALCSLVEAEDVTVYYNLGYNQLCPPYPDCGLNIGQQDTLDCPDIIPSVIGIPQ